MLLSVSGSARRVNESGTAVCLLSGKVGRPTLRRAAWAAATAITLMASFVVLGLVWLPLPELVYLAAAAVFVAPCLRSLFRNRRARRRLRELAPPRPWIYVHGVARVPGEWARGAGAEVMSALTDEADRNGWVLVLDAAAEGLVSYYRRFGFEACGPGVEMTWGSTVRMSRRPRVLDRYGEVLDA
jgi:predicted membrane metal-binding protein